MRYSIILPVCNAEGSLPGCITALLDQPCRDMEILLLDQGSEDATAMLCQGYQAAYPDRVRYIPLPRIGTGPARNRGIDEARGEYLLFADGATLFRSDALADLSVQIEASRADLYLTGAAGKLPGKNGNLLFALRHHPELLLEDVDVRELVWKRQLFDDAYLRFPAQRSYDDLRMTRKAMALSRTMVAVPAPIHVSLSRWTETNGKRELALLDALDDIRGYFQRQGLLEQFGGCLTQLAARLICDRAHQVLTKREDPQSLTECIRYLKTRFPDYESVPMPTWRGQETQKLLELIRQGRWNRLSMLFLLKSFG